MTSAHCVNSLDKHFLYSHMAQSDVTPTGMTLQLIRLTIITIHM